jgi:glycosyltransferase involved in cell wall biosynthesis
MFDVSLIICSHNPRSDYLGRVLKSLQGQTLPSKQWELLLIDNASSPPLAASWDLSWHPHSRHILEEEPGLVAARQRGMRETRSDLIVFIDDDNVINEDYLSRVLDIKANWPALGAWGSGAIIPEYESAPAAYVKDLLQYLALRETDKAHWANVIPCYQATPWGAGMCVRSAVAAAYCRLYKDSTILVSGRRSGSLLSGEDVEIAYVACRLGFGMGIFPELKLTHLIAKERVLPEYLLKLCEGVGTSDALLEHKWFGTFPQSRLRPRILMGIIKNLIVRRDFDRRIYLAKQRSLAAARRIILSSRLREGIDIGTRPSSNDQRGRRPEKSAAPPLTHRL